ncbi:hypothetical protein GP486_005489 [Trichoglossum hirsutum]|uniref:Uncharacterized protein n=1 Tax=Trichoglossum hirsutum TaxID=265104 RepID=A0A9P8RM59_9PEZI|nr:hypothetical protein GP486_005489 [Trichoglossum hirsutum]
MPHWRYISSFHGPWLQLLPEDLESLAHNNYSASRPRHIDPAVFYDLVKIRRLVDEATTLAVRASSGVTSSYRTNTPNANNGLLVNSGVAGLGLGGPGASSRLSKERKHRMRELATQKLSQAYQLDEIAASVATMQSASTLEEVASLVLQRNTYDSDAKYVHFFHEKIPSRMLAKCTSLDPLDDVIADRPSEPAPLRTRAATRMFKEDLPGAARDLTEALAVHKFRQGLHERLDVESGQKARSSKGLAQDDGNGDRKSDTKPAEEDQPSGLEEQLLFHRASVYLAIAIQHIDDALSPTMQPTTEPAVNGTAALDNEGPELTGTIPTPAQDLAERAAETKRENARKIVRTNAKRALRDFLKFLSRFEYTPGLPSDVTDEFLRAFDIAAARVLKEGSGAVTSTTFVEIAKDPKSGLPKLPAPDIYPVANLFSASPPPSLTPYPSADLAVEKKKYSSSLFKDPATSTAIVMLAARNSQESITYHPLLTDALHSILLCHCLIQTPPKELLRHSYMVARLTRVSDGYPIFLAARSPARADWTETVRRAGNWVGLNSSWEALCAPVNSLGQNRQQTNPKERERRRREEALAEAFDNNTVHDEESFVAAVSAIERRGKGEFRSAVDFGETSRLVAQDDGKEYPICTDRAEVITRWVKETIRREQEATAKRKEEAKAKMASSSSSSSFSFKKKQEDHGKKESNDTTHARGNGMSVLNSTEDMDALNALR